MIYLIYAHAQQTDAVKILLFLTEEKKLKAVSKNKNCFILDSDSRIPEDAAIVLVSDAAVAEPEWQSAVRNIPDEVRMIPVGGTQDADYSDPEVIPERIEEINFIRMDENCRKNIWESLTTEKDFYSLKSMILSNMDAWKLSKKSKSFLMADWKAVKMYYKLFQKKMEEEKEPFFKEELAAIMEYLKLSVKYAGKLWLKRNANRVYWIFFSMIWIWVLHSYLFFRSHTKGMATTSVIIGNGSDLTEASVAPVNAVKLVDNISNMGLSYEAGLELFSALSRSLDQNWYYSPIGSCYKWALNDVQVAADERYLWSANGNGAIAKWDAYTGAIVMQEKVSDKPLSAIAVSEKEDFFVAVDFDGYLFKKQAGMQWEKSRESYGLRIDQQLEVQCGKSSKLSVVMDSEGRILYFDLTQGFRLIMEAHYAKAYCTEISENGMEAVVEKDDGSLYDLCVKADGSKKEIPIPVVHDRTCSMDILHGKVLLADKNFQLVTWEKKNPEMVSAAGIVLLRPFFLKFLKNGTAVYHDRNLGTHLYDLERKLDLGTVLSVAGAAVSLYTGKNTVAVASIEYYVENVEPLLPADDFEGRKNCRVYAGKEASSDGTLRRVVIKDTGIIRIDFRLRTGEAAIYIDGRNRFHAGKAQRGKNLLEKDDSTDVFYYEDAPVSFTGDPVTVGIGEDGKTLLIGASDGSFYELVFTDYAECRHGSQRQVPSHSPITAIYQTDRWYYLEDATGTFWKVRIGCDAVTKEGAIAAVKEKLHCAVTDDLLEMISEDTKESLGLVRQQGGGREEWE